MKTTRKLISGIVVAATIFSLAASARAGIFTWSAPTAITTADTTLNQSGTVVGAEVFGNDAKIVVLSNGTVLDFKADNSVASATGNGTAYGGFTNDTGNASFNAVLTQFNYDGGSKTITLNNLVVGQLYSVQLFACDRRDNASTTHVANYQDPSDVTDISANFQMGDYSYTIGTFTANNPSVSIQENLLNSNGGNINALIVRAIGTNVPPQITTQPASATIYHGLTANLAAAALGSGTLVYHWQKSNVGGSVFTNLLNGGKISGATNYSLTITNLAASDSADYLVVVSSAYGSVTSSPAATLTVLAGNPQFVWSAPTSIANADATLNQLGTIVGAATFGATETFVTLTNSSVVDFKSDGSVAQVTSGGFGPAAGAFLGNSGNANFNAVLDQFNYDGGPKTITLYNLFVGQQYSVQLIALDNRTSGDGSGPFRLANYQDPNDVFDVSATFAMRDNSYVIGTFTASNTTVDIQQNLLTGNNGNINAVVVRAIGLIVAPSITTQPSAVTIDQGLTTTFSVAASGTAPLTYHWQKGNVGGSVFTNLVNGGRILGATSTTLAISNIITSDGADYRVVIANAAGSVTSSPAATLTVQPVTPKFVWSLPTAITTADATLNLSGTIVSAAVFGPTPKIVVLTNGTSVDFRTNTSVAVVNPPAGVTTGAFSGNTGNADFNTVLNEFNYDNGPKTITVSNLVAGQQYAVQLFALDDRGGANTRSANFQDPADAFDYSATFSMPDNVYVVGTFTATGTSIDLQENLFNSGFGNINALVLRRLTGLPLAPQISTLPKSAAVFAGTTAQLTVGATGTALTYQWQSASIGSGVFANVSNGGSVSGATTAQLNIANATSANALDYRVIVSNGSGSVTSSPAATLTVRLTAAALTHRWNFNETSGTTAHDSIGTADGTLVNGTGTSVSFSGGKLVLNNPGTQTTGAGSYVAIPGGLVTSLSAVTFEFWYDNTGLNNGNPLICFGGAVDPTTLHGTNFINFFARWSGSTTAFEIQTTAGDSGVVTLGARQQSSTFHWVMIYDPIAGTVSVYLNGSLQASASGITIPLSTVGTGAGYIGYSAWNQVGGNSDPNLPLGSFSSQYGFNGNGNYPYLNANIDEMRIYDGALNTNAIAATQLLGPNQLLSNVASLSVANTGTNLALAWPIVNGGFALESSPTLGAGAVWTPVSGTKSVAGSNYQMFVSSTNATAFFRLRQ